MTDRDLQIWCDNLLLRYRRENPSFPLLRVPTFSETLAISDVNARIEPKRTKVNQSNYREATVETRLYSLFAD